MLLSLPAFANAANRALHERLLKRNRQLARATADTRENQERASVMGEHLKHIRAELAAAQRVAEAKAKELKTEEHLAAMAERALGRSRQDVSAHDSRLADARAQSAALQAQIDKGAERLEAFRASMNWKKEELERWTAAARQREEDVRALDECVARGGGAGRAPCRTRPPLLAAAPPLTPAALHTHTHHHHRHNCPHPQPRPGTRAPTSSPSAT